MPEEYNNETGNQPVKHRKRHLSKKGIAVLAGGFILITGGIFKINHHRNYETPLELDSSVSYLITHDDTVTILGYSSSDLVKEIDFLDCASSVYTKLHSIDLDIYDMGLDRISIDEMDEKYIDDLIKKYTRLKRGDLKTPSPEAIEFYNVVNELISYREALTEERFIKGIDTINIFSDIVFNSTIKDTLHEEMDYFSISSNLTDSTSKDLEIHYITPSNMDFKLEVSYFCDLEYFKDSLNKLNTMKDNYYNGTNTNIKSIIKQEYNTIQFIKTCIYNEYKINNGVISQYENHNEVKQKVKVK